MAERSELPLLRRFPGLARLPRVSLGEFPTPVTRIQLPEGALSIKREDLSGRAGAIGGNKVRALEWLLGSVRPGDRIVTVGPTGSTHALATTLHAKSLGATTTVVRWPQEMNPAARRVDARLRSVAEVIDAPNVVAAYASAWRRRSRAHWVPAGGTTPLGILGQVNAALELLEQVEREKCPAFSEIVVPLGTGGTAAGIALGLCIGGSPAGVRAIRVGPRIVGSGARIMWLAWRTARLIERVTGERVSRVDREDLLVLDEYYAGGYGRPIGLIAEERVLSAAGVQLDDTYSRKAFVAAVDAQPDSAVFWLTFDGRLLTSE